jgi:hypothetical protein
MPALLYDITRVLLLLSVPAALVCLLNAGIALRREGGTVFWVGGGFSKWMLWAVIFLGLQPTLSWFQFFRAPVYFPPGAGIGTPWLSSIQQDVSNFVSSFIVGRIAPIAAAYFVLRAVLDIASGASPLPSILCAMFLSAISSTQALLSQWTPAGNRFSVAVALESAWTYLASQIMPIAAGLAICAAIVQFAFNRPGYLRLVMCAGAFLTVSALWILITKMM